jgi:hypothetical protein
MAKTSFIVVFAFLVALAFNIAILLWLHKLKQTKCECADNWKRTYMFYYLIYSIVYSIFIIGGLKQLVNYKNIVYALTSISSIAGLLYVIFGIQYLTALRKNDCQCAKDIRETILFYWLWIDVGLLVLSAILSLFVFGTIMHLSNISK